MGIGGPSLCTAGVPGTGSTVKGSTRGLEGGGGAPEFGGYLPRVESLSSGPHRLASSDADLSMR